MNTEPVATTVASSTSALAQIVALALLVACKPNSVRRILNMPAAFTWSLRSAPVSGCQLTDLPLHPHHYADVRESVAQHFERILHFPVELIQKGSMRIRAGKARRVPAMFAAGFLSRKKT